MDSKYWDNIHRTSLANQSAEPSDFGLRAAARIKALGYRWLLDIGAGSGRDTKLFYDMGLDITALDISEIAISRVREVAPGVKTVLGDIADMDFPAGSFDCVYARLALQYFNDETVERIFGKIYDALADGGFLFIQNKSEKDWEYGIGTELERDMFLVPPESYATTHAIKFFTLDYLREKARRFKIIELGESAGDGRAYSNLVAMK
ncbi:MAG: class I SAM-dependent methyltransferase [Alphaproteobacteria bacterium]|nr:class I SAM-dependent methyltransferase [Alphaproteobacteria bacterium]